MRVRHDHAGPIALDIGTAGLKVVQLEDGVEEPCVRAAAWKPFPKGLREAERVRWSLDALRPLLAARAFSGRRVVLALQPSEFQIKSLRLPRMPRDELAAAVQFEAQERFTFDGEPGQFRFVVAGDVRQGTELKEELIVFGVRESKIDAILQDFERLKLEPVAIDAAPCAIARGFCRFLRRQEDAAAVNIFVDVGRTATSVVVTRGTQVVFVKVIDVGGQRFDASVAERLGIAPDQANEVRLAGMQAGMAQTRQRRATDPAGGETAPASVRQQVADALRPSIEHLAREIQLCLRYFAVTFRGQKAESLTFVGGEAHEPSIRKLVEEIVDVPCLIGDPFCRMKVAADGGLPGSVTYRPAWGVAVGLALRGSKWVAPSTLPAATEPAKVAS